MCGIFGIYNIENSKNFNCELFKASLNKMAHRGPDAMGVKHFEAKCILGHRRLSIIDLKPESNQPFNLDERYWITYNGEIYNYLELRNELYSAGFEFRTESDTEVLIRSYQFWGEDCVNRFNGMWAFAIYDVVENKIFCSRDRFGVKPFNYALVDCQFSFSSEIKSLISYFPQLKVPNYNVISNYCRHSVGAQHEETWFEGVYRLMPAHNMVVAKDGIRRYRYWQYPAKADKNITFEQAKEQYYTLFLDAVKLRMRSDVPVGTTLSSGIDSNSIVYSLRQFYKGGHHTFTADFKDYSFNQTENEVYKDKSMSIDEAEIVRRSSSSLDLTSHFIKIDYSNFVNDLSKMIYHLESGHSSTAVVPINQLFEKAKQYVTVILEGQGADELLGYQQKHFISIFFTLVRDMKFSEAYVTLKKNIESYSVIYSLKMFLRQASNRFSFIQSFYQLFSRIGEVFSDKLVLRKLMKDYPDYTGDEPDTKINKELLLQHIGGLVNLLHYGDAISMSHSLESRLPFMDYRLVEFSFKLPWQFKIHEDLAKYIHREALKGVVPNSILYNPIKFGFNTPVSQFFKQGNNLKDCPNKIILSEKCISRGLFNIKGLRRIIKEHEKGEKNHSTFLYRLLSVELWFREFID